MLEWGVLNGTHRLEKMNGSEVGIVTDRWIGARRLESRHSRRSVGWRSPISSVRNRRSPELRRSRRMRVLGERMIRDRSGMLGDRVVYTPPQGAHRRISQQT